MVRSLLLPVAFASVSVIGLPAMAHAQPQMYRVALASPVTTTTIVKDVQWSCAGEACSAVRTGSSPDRNVCAAVVRKLGAVTAFAAGDKTFDAAQVEQCNAAAR